MTRLTDQQRADRALVELDFQRMLVGPRGLATQLGWLHVHFRPAKTATGWKTPGSGELLEGWPDLVLVRQRDRRLIFAELKRELGHLTDSQAEVLDLLGCLAAPVGDFRAADGVPDYPRIEVYVWRPSDLPAIAEVLR